MPDRPGSTSSAAARTVTRRCWTAGTAAWRCSRARRRGKATSSRPTRPTTRSRSRSRTGRSTPTGRCSTPTHGSSSTASSRTTSPSGEFSPIWNPEFFGNTIMVNGNTWPFQTVQRRRYRFRFLNGCQSRFLILDFDQIPGVEVWAIGNEGGFLAAPVNLTADNGNRLLMGLAERADLIVDFTNVPVGSYILRNVGPDEPFGGGEPAEPDEPGDFDAADPETTGQVLQFRVVPAAGPDPSTPPRFLQLPALTPLPPEVRTRPLALIEKAGVGFDADGNEVEGPVEALLGTVDVGSHGGAALDGSGDREPRGRRHRGLGDLQHHRRRAPDARPRAGLRGGRPAGPAPRRRRRGGGRPAHPARRRPHAAPTRGRPGSRTPWSRCPAR